MGLCFIFDLDGCLIDSREVQKAAFFGSYQEIVGDENCPAFEEYLKHTGDSVNGMLNKMGLPAEMAVPFRRISCEQIDQITVNKKLVECIRLLKRCHASVGLCTGKDHDRTIQILQKNELEELFDVLICGDDVTEPKPSAMPILKAMEGLGAVRENTIMIGDGYNDILSAKNAGVRSILTLWYGDEGVPREADYVAKTEEDLLEIVQHCLNL